MVSRHMLPLSSQRHIADCGYGDSVFTCQLPTGNISFGVALANLYHGLFGKFGGWLSFASYVAVFLHHIHRVVEWSSKKKVCRIRTDRIVASVADDHALGDRAKVNHVRHARCCLPFSIPMRSAISLLANWPLPSPTFIVAALFHACPKSVDFGCYMRQVSMPVYIAIRKAFNDAIFGVGAFGDRCRLAATAHAQAARVGVFGWQSWVISCVALNIANGLTCHMPKFGLRLLGNIGRLTASAFTEFWGIMGLHKNLHFLCQAWDVRSVARHFSLGITPVILPQGTLYE